MISFIQIYNLIDITVYEKLRKDGERKAEGEREGERYTDRQADRQTD